MWQHASRSFSTSVCPRCGGLILSRLSGATADMCSHPGHAGHTRRTGPVLGGEHQRPAVRRLTNITRKGKKWRIRQREREREREKLQRERQRETERERETEVTSSLSDEISDECSFLVPKVRALCSALMTLAMNSHIPFQKIRTLRSTSLCGIR